MPIILVTGASGILGTAIFDALRQSAKYEVIGLAHSRPAPHLRQVDLCQESAVDTLFTELAMGEGDWVIHCAAERRPDVAEKVGSV
jgi:S-adenosylmethionine synthetase